MKKLLFILVLAFALGAMLMAQAPAPGAPAAGAARGGGGGAQRGGPPVPAATGPMLDIANQLAAAINKQDAATLTKMVAPDAVYLDEDGHAPPVARWITNLTTGTPAKTMVISSSHSQMWDTGGWVSFNYTVNENFKDMPKAVKGTASIVVKKQASGDWQIVMIHGALEQKVAGLTQ